MPDVMTPSEWAQTPVTPETPTTDAPETGVATEAAPAVETTAPAPNPVVDALVKGGMPEADAKTLFETASKPQEIKDALEAYLDGKPYPVPKSLTFKLKSGSTVTEKSLEALQREGMLMQDYQLRRGEITRREREMEQAFAQHSARVKALEAREAWFKEQQQEMAEAQKDPEKWARWQELQALAKADPRVAKMMDDALASREATAQYEAIEAAQRQVVINANVDLARQWIQQIGQDPRYSGIDPERVRMMHARELSITGDQPNGWRNTPDHIRAIYDQELAAVDRVASPVKSELEALKAELQAIKEAQGIESHNAKTARVLERSKAPNTAPAGGAPAAPVRLTERKPIIGKEAIEKATSDWAKVRD